MKKRLQNFLLIEHGGDRKQFTLNVLKEKNLHVYIACSSIPSWLRKHISPKNIIQTDTYNTTKLLADVVTCMQINNIRFDAVGTFYEHTVTQTADLAHALGLIGLYPGAARRSSHNKLLMRMTCKENNIPTPKFRVASISNVKALKQAIHEIGTPCVVKPIFGAESYGTIKVEKGFSLQKILQEIKLNTTSDKKEVFKNFTGTVLVEEYLPGKVVSVDGIIQNHKIMIAGMVEFLMGPEPRFTQEANYIPTRLEKETIKTCKSMAKQVIQTLGFNNCGFHCELRLTPKGPVLLEIAARLPGGPLQLGYQKAHGFNLTSLLVDVWLGKKISLKPSHSNYVLQKAVFPRSNGKIQAMKGIKNVKNMKNVWEFVQILKAGQQTVTYPNIPIPYYYYALHAKTKKSLENLSKKVEDTVKVKLQ